MFFRSLLVLPAATTLGFNRLSSFYSCFCQGEFCLAEYTKKENDSNLSWIDSKKCSTLSIRKKRFLVNYTLDSVCTLARMSLNVTLGNLMCPE